MITRGLFNNVKTIAIFGNSGTGKTALAYHILKQFTDKKVYFLNHPNPKIISKMGWNNIISIERMEKIENCVLYIDEPQIHIRMGDKKSNEVIAKICSLARQKNITLLISSCDTRVFTKHNESFFDMWIIKDLDYDMVKNGSKIKRIIEKNSLIDPRGFNLNIEEYIIDCNSLSLSQKETFELEDYFTDEHSRPYAKVVAPSEALCNENNKNFLASHGKVSTAAELTPVSLPDDSVTAVIQRSGG